MTTAGASLDDMEKGLDCSHPITLLLVERTIFDAPPKNHEGGRQNLAYSMVHN